MRALTLLRAYVASHGALSLAAEALGVGFAFVLLGAVWVVTP